MVLQKFLTACMDLDVALMDTWRAVFLHVDVAFALLFILAKKKTVAQWQHDEPTSLIWIWDPGITVGSVEQYWGLCFALLGDKQFWRGRFVMSQNNSSAVNILVFVF